MSDENNQSWAENWTGRQAEAQDTLRPQPAQFMQAALDRPPDLQAGDALPPLWHWLYFLEAARARDLGRDAHPKKGGFLPPVPLPRRMWAGGRLTFHRPLLLGGKARKRSTVQSITPKQGRSGPLCFVTIAHELFQNDALSLREEHDIVYRSDPAPDAPKPAPEAAPEGGDMGEQITPNEALLFRYSALTFNGHRIHYDLDYARQIEGYEGLVFHGPLTATLLMGLACRETGAAPASFEYRGIAPITGMAPFWIKGRREGGALDLWAETAHGALAMTARAEF